MGQCLGNPCRCRFSLGVLIMSKQELRGLFSVSKFGAGDNVAPVLHRRFASPEATIQWCNAQPLLRDVWARHDERHNSDSWCGLAGQAFEDLIHTGKGSNATQAFNKATAKLQAEKLAVGGAPIPALSGGAWVIPAYLSGNPLCARIRPRSKLPHKDFRFSLQCSAYVDQTELGAIGATIARAIWEYVMAGGTCSLTMYYTYGFTKAAPESGAQAICFEVNIPISGVTSIALALSTAFYRPVLMNTVSHGFSPTSGDSIPMKRELQPPNVIPLNGEWRHDRSKLQAAGIAC